MNEEVHTLTGAYAAHALDDEERRFFARHLETCDPCAREVAELQATTARLGAAAAEPPPAALRDRVLAEIDRTRQEAPRPRAAEPAPGRSRWGRLLVPVAAVLVLFLGAGVLVNDLYDRLGNLEREQDRYTELLAAPDARWVEADGPDGSTARLVLSASRGEAMLVVDNMAPAPHQHVYELWLIGQDGAVPAGLFDVDEQGRVVRMVTGDLAGADAVGVTVEPDGGSPQPTSDPVMVLDLSAAAPEA